jgi:hypothetical protein
MKDLDVIPDNPRITFQHGELGEASIEIQKIKKEKTKAKRKSHLYNTSIKKRDTFNCDID